MFKDVLKMIVTDCSGGLGAVLMGFDGIAIDQFSVDDVRFDVNFVSIEYSNIAKEIMRTAEFLKLGELHEMTIKTDQLYIVLKLVNEEYFLALVIDSHGNFGQGRFLLTRESYNLKKDLE